MSIFYGVGVGPGDPELLTLKALRCIERADVVCFLVNDKGESQAKYIAREAFLQPRAQQQLLPIPMPFLTERTLANQAYDLGAAAICEQLAQGKSVAFLCEGDPLFFGSFTYLLDRIKDRFSCQVIPGISSINAAAATLVHPLTMLSESFAVLSGRHSQGKLQAALLEHDSVVIMKAGQARMKILAALEATGRTAQAQYLEYVGRDNQWLEPNVALLPREAGPYFSLFIVTSNQRQHRAPSVNPTEVMND